MKDCLFKFAPIVLIVTSSAIWLGALVSRHILGPGSILVPGIIAQLLLFLFCGFIIRKLYRQANTDSLTGICNRRCFFSWMGTIFRMKFPVSLMIIDIDYFKPINDTYGHLAGDEALKQFARLLKENVRNTDKVARLGGDEFAVILPQTSCENALKIAERIKQAVEEKTFVFNGSNDKITISIGIASAQFPIHAEIFLNCADKALQKAKETKNAVVVYSDPEMAAT